MMADGRQSRVGLPGWMAAKKRKKNTQTSENGSYGKQNRS